MTTETIDIRIREDGSRVVKRNIEDIGSSAKKSADGVDVLKRALGYLAGFLAINQVKQYADAWASASGKIRIATESISQASAVQDLLFKSSQNARREFSGMADLYSRTARSGKELAASQSDILRFTELVGKSVSVQGVTDQQASGALFQLGQALGSGIVRAEEFNSILEGTPYILQIAAKNIDEAGGSVAKLRKMMIDGQLTSKVFFDAILEGSSEIETDFLKSSFTISQGFTLMQNAAMKYIGELDKSLGVSNAFGKGAKWVADNMDLIAVTIAAIGVAVAIAFAPGAIVAFTRSLMSLWALLLANPFTALLTAIAMATVYLVAFRNEIKVGIDDITSIGDVFAVLWSDIASGFNYLREAVFGELAREVAAVYQAITSSTQDETNNWMASYDGFYDGVGTGFAGVVKSIARTVDAIAGLLTGMGIAIVRTFAGLPEAISTPFKRMYNTVAEWIEKMVNITITGVNKLRSALGKDLIDSIQIQRAEVNDKYFEEYGANIAASINDGFQQQGGFAEKWVDGIFKRAQEHAKARTGQLSTGGSANLDKAMGSTNPAAVDEKAAEKAAKAMSRLQNNLMSLLNTIAPIPGAMLEMQQAEELLTKSTKAGLITKKEQGQYMRLLQNYYKDILDPLGKVNRELDEQAMLLNMTADAREVEAALLHITRDLLNQGVEITEKDTKALRAKLTTLQQLSKVIREQDSILEQSVGRRQRFTDSLTAIQRALSTASQTGFTQGDANAALVDMAPDLFAGTQQAVDAQLQIFQEGFAQIKAMREANMIDEQTADQMRLQNATAMSQALINLQIQQAQMRLELGSGSWADSALVSIGRITEGFTTFSAGATEAMGDFFTNFTDGFANSVGRAIVDSENLGEALHSVAKQAVASLISALVKLGIQWVVNAALGQSLAAAGAATSTALTTATAEAAAAAWAPAAALASLASFGANSAPAMAGMTATMALSESMALMSLAGFKAGGYTGEAGISEVAGLVHGKEFVVNAQATAANRPALEAMNRGQAVGGSQVNVKIENYGTSKEFEVEQLSEGDIRIIARDEAKQVVRSDAPKVFATAIANPNSDISKSFGQNTTVQRRRN